ncbi:hypothetical protein AM593_08793, partial [Mytilus galloprovincialis]
SQSPKPEKSKDVVPEIDKILVYETPYLPHDIDRPSDEYSIVVLHVEDNIRSTETNNIEHTESAETLQSFMEHLKTQADEWGYSHIKINFFEDLFYWCNPIDKILFTDVLEKCDMIFVFMSDNFRPGKLKRYGLPESSVNFALKTSNDFPTVKTVGACDQCKLYAKDFDFHLNYSSYKNSKDIDLYERTLREIYENL